MEFQTITRTIDEDIIITNKMTTKSIFQLSLIFSLLFFLLGKIRSFAVKGVISSNPFEDIFFFLMLFLIFSFISTVFHFLIKEQYVFDISQRVIKYNIDELFRLVDAEFFFSDFKENNFLLVENSQSFLKIDLHHSRQHYLTFRDSLQSVDQFAESKLDFLIIDLIEKVPFMTNISYLYQDRSLLINIQYFNKKTAIYFSLIFSTVYTLAIILINIINNYFFQESGTVSLEFLLEALIIGNILIGFAYILIYHYDKTNKTDFKFTLTDDSLIYENNKITFEGIEIETNPIIVGGKTLSSILLSPQSTDNDVEKNSDQNQFGFLFISDNLEVIELLKGQIGQLFS